MSSVQGKNLEICEVSTPLRKACPYVILCTLVLFSAFLGLGVLRLYSFRLEDRLNGINRQIESFAAKQILLRQKHSALLSPGRVYSFSKNTLGMIFASNVKVLQINETLLADAGRDEIFSHPEETGSEGWFHFFLEKALAGE